MHSPRVGLGSRVMSSSLLGLFLLAPLSTVLIAVVTICSFASQTHLCKWKWLWLARVYILQLHFFLFLVDCWKLGARLNLSVSCLPFPPGISSAQWVWWTLPCGRSEAPCSATVHPWWWGGGGEPSRETECVCGRQAGCLCAHGSVSSLSLSFSIKILCAQALLKFFYISGITYVYVYMRILYSGKLSREKTFANWWKIWIFGEKTLCRAKGCHTPQISQRKLSRIAIKPLNLQMFSPSKVFPLYDMSKLYTDI